MALKIKKIVIKPAIEAYLSEYRNMNICLTGEFIIQDVRGNTLSRDKIKQIIELGGSTVHDFIQDDTEILVAADPNVYSDKKMEALPMNIYVMSEEEFWESNKQVLDYRVFK